MNNNLEEIRYDNEIIAIIIRADFKAEGIAFFTPGTFSQQLGYLGHPAGKKIKPHIHNLIAREIKYTQEVLFIKKGKIKVDLFSRQKNYIESKILFQGDIILLASGGHGLEILEQSEIIEIKQGPYLGADDKEHF